MSLGKIATWVVQVGGAYVNSSKFTCLLPAMYSVFCIHMSKIRKVILIVALWFKFWGEDFNSSFCTLDVSFSGAEYLKICLNLAIDNV